MAKKLRTKYRLWAQKHGTPWEVSFPRHGDTPGKRRFFRTEELATAAIVEWERVSKAVALGKRELDEVLYVRELLPPGVTLLNAVRFYLEHNSGRTTVTLREVVAAYQASLVKQDASTKYKEAQAWVVQLILTELGEKTLFSLLGKRKLLEFIDAGPGYWNRYARHRLVSVLVTQACKMDAIKSDPLLGYKFEKAPPRGTPHFLHTADVEIIMNYVDAHRPELVPAFAFQFFAGIRTRELCRLAEGKKRPLAWSDVKWGVQIDVPVAVSKTNSRRLILHWPAALTHWCRKAGDGLVCPVANLETIKGQIIRTMNAKRVMAGLPAVPFKLNDFRHSYATHSYHLDSVGIEKTKDYMGHTENSELLRTRYRGYVTNEQAVTYFASGPRSTHERSSDRKNNEDCAPTTATASPAPMNHDLLRPIS